jgi:hypothetical protein
MMSPDGSLGEVPIEQVEVAQALGFRRMSEQDLAAMYQKTFMTHMLLKDRDEKLAKKFARRQSLRKQMQRGRGR